MLLSARAEHSTRARGERREGVFCFVLCVCASFVCELVCCGFGSGARSLFFFSRRRMYGYTWLVCVCVWVWFFRHVPDPPPPPPRTHPASTPLLLLLPSSLSHPLPAPAFSPSPSPLLHTLLVIPPPPHTPFTFWETADSQNPSPPLLYHPFFFKKKFALSPPPTNSRPHLSHRKKRPLTMGLEKTRMRRVAVPTPDTCSTPPLPSPPIPHPPLHSPPPPSRKAQRKKNETKPTSNRLKMTPPPQQQETSKNGGTTRRIPTHPPPKKSILYSGGEKGEKKDEGRKEEDGKNNTQELSHTRGGGVRRGLCLAHRKQARATPAHTTITHHLLVATAKKNDQPTKEEGRVKKKRQPAAFFFAVAVPQPVFPSFFLFLSPSTPFPSNGEHIRQSQQFAPVDRIQLSFTMSLHSPPPSPHNTFAKGTAASPARIHSSCFYSEHFLLLGGFFPHPHSQSFSPPPPLSPSSKSMTPPPPHTIYVTNNTVLFQRGDVTRWQTSLPPLRKYSLVPVRLCHTRAHTNIHRLTTSSCFQQNGF